MPKRCTHHVLNAACLHELDEIVIIQWIGLTEGAAGVELVEPDLARLPTVQFLKEWPRSAIFQCNQWERQVGRVGG
jgi:hypothetical protein